MDRAEWRRLRAAFCHDWLKNRFLAALRAAVNCLDGHVDDPEIQRRFFEDVLPSWTKQHDGAVALVQTFEQAASPRGEVRLWIAEQHSPLDEDRWQSVERLGHELWLARNDVEVKQAHALAVLEAVESSYRGLEAILRSERREKDRVRAAIVEFGDKLRELAEALSVLPADRF